MGRKYKQRGYQEQDQRASTPRPARPKGPREGPRSPLMPGFEQVMRCSLCGGRLPRGLTDITPQSRCPKCRAALHSCRNCVYFDPSSRFECSQPVQERVVSKQEGNDCAYFEARTAVEKITTSGAERPADARNAFEDLFKK